MASRVPYFMRPPKWHCFCVRRHEGCYIGAYRDADQATIAMMVEMQEGEDALDATIEVVSAWSRNGALRIFERSLSKES